MKKAKRSESEACQGCRSVSVTNFPVTLASLETVFRTQFHELYSGGTELNLSGLIVQC